MCLKIYYTASMLKRKTFVQYEYYECFKMKYTAHDKILVNANKCVHIIYILYKYNYTNTVFPHYRLKTE
jgi:hypothetical protein